MSASGRGPVLYVLKRYPRLTETFILNEIRAMERLGERLIIFSLLPPEPPPHHPMVAEVCAPVHSPPPHLGAQVRRVLGAHARMLAVAPWRYLRALGLALRRTLTSRHPLSLWRQFARAGVLAALCRRAGVRHIHAHFANAPTSVAHFAHRMSGIPFSFTAHAKDLYLTKPALIRGRASAATFVATCTGYNAQYLRDLVDAPSRDKISLIYHGIDLATFRYRPPPYRFLETGGPPLILSVGRLVPKKGLDGLLQACSLLDKSGFDFRCDIVGAGPLRDSLAADIARLGLDTRVRLRGAMTHAELVLHFARADLFVLAPQITEDGDRDGIPNVIVEAMATGVPVVSSEVSGIPEMVIDGVTGLLVPPRDPAALAASMRRLLTDPVLGRAMASEGRARLDRCFDCWQTVRQLGGLMEQKRVCEAVPAPQQTAQAA